jgi:hypothetical protein
MRKASDSVNSLCPECDSRLSIVGLAQRGNSRHRAVPFSSFNQHATENSDNGTIATSTRTPAFTAVLNQELEEEWSDSHYSIHSRCATIRQLSIRTNQP